jgi:prepilin-type N-terminal cleavage/methylation domain-containing protein
MKRPYHRRPSSKYSSFTLVELLVVMGIIAILASVLFAVGSSSIAAAKRVQAANLANQINTAILGYYTEYSVYPIPSTATTDSAAGALCLSNDPTDWMPLTYALAGGINPANPTAALTGTTVSNTRAISYLTLKKNDVDPTTGVPVNPSFPNNSNGNNYFNVAMDANYDNLITVANTTNGTLNVVIAQGSAVWANCNTTATSTNSAFWVKTY